MEQGERRIQLRHGVSGREKGWGLLAARMGRDALARDRGGPAGLRWNKTRQSTSWMRNTRTRTSWLTLPLSHMHRTLRTKHTQKHKNRGDTTINLSLMQQFISIAKERRGLGDTLQDGEEKSSCNYCNCSCEM